MIWGVVVHAADIHDGQKAHLLVEYCLGYLERMKKKLVDDAYKKGFLQWVETNIIGLDIEFASRPPTWGRLCEVRQVEKLFQFFGLTNFTKPPVVRSRP